MASKGLWALRAAHPLPFDILLFAAQVQPHIPVLFLRLWLGSSLDAALLGPAAVPLFSWALALFLPGFLCARYAARFFSGSPLLSFSLCASFVASDIGLWFGVSTTLRASARSSFFSWPVARRLLAPWVFVALYAASTAALWGVTLGAGSEACVLVLAGAFLYNHAVSAAVAVLWHRLRWARGAADPRWEGPSRAVVAELDAPGEALFSREAWTTRYELTGRVLGWSVSAPLYEARRGGGGTGAAAPVLRGAPVAFATGAAALAGGGPDGGAVCVKLLRTRSPEPEALTAAAAIALAAHLRLLPGFAPAGPSHLLALEPAEAVAAALPRAMDALAARMGGEFFPRARRAAGGLQEALSVAGSAVHGLFVHEVRALRAVAALLRELPSAPLPPSDPFSEGSSASCPPFFSMFEAAFEPLGEAAHAAIVMAPVGASWECPIARVPQRLTTAQALRALGRLARGVSALHRAGIAHRDIRLGNVCSASDELWAVPVLCGFATALLPRAADPFLGPECGLTGARAHLNAEALPPEFFSTVGALIEGDEMVGGGVSEAGAEFLERALGRAGDVWALGLTSLQLLFGVNGTAVVCALHGELHCRAGAAAFLREAGHYAALALGGWVALRSAVLSGQWGGLRGGWARHAWLKVVMAGWALGDTEALLAAAARSGPRGRLLALPTTLGAAWSAQLRALLGAMLHPDPGARCTSEVAASEWAALWAGFEGLPESARGGVAGFLGGGGGWGGGGDAPTPLAGFGGGTPPPARSPLAPTAPFHAHAPLHNLALLRRVVRAMAAEAAAHPTSAAAAQLPRVEPAALLASLKATLSRAGGRGNAVTRDQLLAAMALPEMAPAAQLFPSGPDQLFQLLSADGGATVDRRQVLAGVGFVLAPLVGKDAAARLLFAAYDVEQPFGRLSEGELAELLDANLEPPAGGEPPLESVAALLRRAWDRNEDGGVDFEEFRRGLGRDAALEAALLGREEQWAAGSAAAGAGVPQPLALAVACTLRWRVAAALVKSAAAKALRRFAARESD